MRVFESISVRVLVWLGSGALLVACHKDAQTKPRKPGWTDTIYQESIQQCESFLAPQIKTPKNTNAVCACWMDDVAANYSPEQLSSSDTSIENYLDSSRQACGTKFGETVFIVALEREPQARPDVPDLIKKSLAGSKKKADAAAGAHVPAPAAPAPGAPAPTAPVPARPIDPVLPPFTGTLGEKLRRDNKDRMRELHSKGKFVYCEDFDALDTRVHESLAQAARYFLDGEAGTIKTRLLPTDFTMRKACVTITLKDDPIYGLTGNGQTMGEKVRNRYRAQVVEFYTKLSTVLCIEKIATDGIGKNLTPEKRLEKIAWLVADTRQVIFAPATGAEGQVCMKLTKTPTIPLEQYAKGEYEKLTGMMEASLR